MTVASSLGVSSCETSGSSSKSERITGSSRVPDANIREQVRVGAGNRASVYFDTFGGSSGPIQGSSSRVVQVPR